MFSISGTGHFEAIVVYLAIQEPGKSVLHDVLKEVIYGNKIMNNDDIQRVLDNNRNRIRERIRKSIEKEFPHWADSINKFDLFKRSNARENSSWRLSESCEVQGPGLLLKFYQRVQAIKTGMDTIPITEKELTHMALLAIKHYSNNYLKKYTNHEEYRGGYLVDKLSEDPFESWAGDFFQECRRKYICILRYVAECLFQLWRDTRKKKYLDLVTMMYKKCAYAATCELIDHVLGEEALRFCIDRTCVMTIVKKHKRSTMFIKNASGEFLQYGNQRRKR